LPTEEQSPFTGAQAVGLLISTVFRLFFFSVEGLFKLPESFFNIQQLLKNQYMRFTRIDTYGTFITFDLFKYLPVVLIRYINIHIRIVDVALTMGCYFKGGRYVAKVSLPYILLW